MDSSQMTSTLKAVFLWATIALALVACSRPFNPSDEAIRYSATLAVEPENETALINRCAHYINLERYAEAEADCTRALQLEPNNIHALQNRATAYQRWGRLSQSLADWKQALALMEHDEFWRTNGPERIDDARNQIQSIRQQLESGS